jgi:hypothetical protein
MWPKEDIDEALALLPGRRHQHVFEDRHATELARDLKGADEAKLGDVVAAAPSDIRSVKDHPSALGLECSGD